MRQLPTLLPWAEQSLRRGTGHCPGRPSCLCARQSRARAAGVSEQVAPAGPGHLRSWSGRRGCAGPSSAKGAVSPHSCADEGSGLLPGTTRPKTDHVTIKIFFISVCTHQLRFPGQHWRVRSVLALASGPRPAPCPAVASGIVGRLLQAFEGQLAPVGGVGARRAAGVGAVGRGRVFGGI